MNNLLEVCCGSFEDALQADKAHAQRIELNSALYLGGLTPSLGSLIKTKTLTNIKTVCMVRPRAGGFCYSNDDIEVMFTDAILLLENGADGLAFGFLNEDSTIKYDLTKKMIDLIHSYQKEAVFHRAIDVSKNYEESIKALIELGCDRILTSGSYATVNEGKDIMKSAYETYGSKIEFVMGSGVNENNAQQLIDYTGIHQVHSSCKGFKEDPTTSNQHVSYQYLDSNNYEVVDIDKVKAILNAIK
ncbi:copper homeostasis protein CutC [Breznakia pachnodae]|uniref:Copper homeostasis protein cutC homolog n=1 Tax=Breznakia pachnodae TaxID=265178 RepID=A0ABU0DZN3_9FIRM|nr:copper homeostasis protein CutC [Breznakia pachnodae]MDQ0360104.1 copper homeostasis protein [Breznakia pachnodae]